MERFKIIPTVPSGPCSTTSTTAWRKFGSSNDGLATKSTPFPTDDGADSMPARAGAAYKTVRSPPSKKIAMALRTPAKPGAFEYSDVRAENTYILRFSRLQWEIPERLRLACRGCQLAKWHNARFAGLRGPARQATRPAGLLPCRPCYKCSFRACSYHPFKAGGPISLPLRASNEHILIVRVARAQETNGPPFI